MRSGLILAGGRSSRFGGEEKSLKVLGGKRMICRVIEAICGPVDEVIISVRDERQRDLLCPFVGDHAFVYDEIRDMGPLAGVYAGLLRARGEYVVVVACDMPYISTKAVEFLFERAEGHDAAIPMHDNGLIEPLHAVYGREPMLTAVRASIDAGESKVSAPARRLKDVVYVPEGEIRKVDPSLDTFLNVNRAEDMERADEKERRAEKRPT